MTLGFHTQCFGNQRLERLTPAQRIAQIRLQIAEQARTQMSIGR